MVEYLKVGQSFVGFDVIKKIVDAAEDKITKLWILTLFLTGGRTSECLSLLRSNFDMKTSKYSIIVRNMDLSKKFVVVDQILSEHFMATEKVWTKRDAFPILYQEPLTAMYEKMLWRLEPYEELFSSLNRKTAYYYTRIAGGKAGIKVSDHWFRGQRASCLQEVYLFRKDECNTFFGWLKPAREMWSRYGSTTWRYLEIMMAKGLKEKEELDAYLDTRP